MIGYPWYGPEYEGFSGPFDQRPVEPRCLTYTGAPLERDIEASGPVRATLYVSSSAPDTDWVVRLSDVSPDGAVRPVAEGILQGPLPRIGSRGTPRATRRGVRSTSRSVVYEQPVPQGPPHQGPGHE